MTSDDIDAIRDESDIFDEDGEVKSEYEDDLEVLFDAFAKLSRDEKALGDKKVTVRAKILSQWLGKDSPAITSFGRVFYKKASVAKEVPNKDAALKILQEEAVNFDKAVDAFVTFGFDEKEVRTILSSAKGEFDIPTKTQKSKSATLAFEA